MNFVVNVFELKQVPNCSMVPWLVYCAKFAVSVLNWMQHVLILQEVNINCFLDTLIDTNRNEQWRVYFCLFVRPFFLSYSSIFVWLLICVHVLWFCSSFGRCHSVFELSNFNMCGQFNFIWFKTDRCSELCKNHSAQPIHGRICLKITNSYIPLDIKRKTKYQKPLRRKVSLGPDRWPNTMSILSYSKNSYRPSMDCLYSIWYNKIFQIKGDLVHIWNPPFLEKSHVIEKTN